MKGFVSFRFSQTFFNFYHKLRLSFNFWILLRILWRVLFTFFGATLRISSLWNIPSVLIWITHESSLCMLLEFRVCVHLFTTFINILWISISARKVRTRLRIWRIRNSWLGIWRLVLPWWTTAAAILRRGNTRGNKWTWFCRELVWVVYIFGLVFRSLVRILFFNLRHSNVVTISLKKFPLCWNGHLIF